MTEMQLKSKFVRMQLNAVRCTVSILAKYVVRVEHVPDNI